MTCSLIITTYNWEEALQQVLFSCATQTLLPDEIIIADDGSSEKTKKVIENFAHENPTLPIIHSWQEDLGFRASMSRNRAIAQANGEYIILIDGDICLHQNFIQDHLSFAKKGFFTQGTRVLVEKHLTQKIFQAKKLTLNFFSQGIKNRKNTLHSKFLSSLFSTHKNHLKGIKTCNLAFFKKDCLAINGFNEDFVGWGREDSEFAVRLLNYGIKRHDIRFNAIAYHLYHPENTRASLPQNDAILKNTIEQKLVWCNNGINKYLKGLDNDN